MNPVYDRWKFCEYVWRGKVEAVEGHGNTYCFFDQWAPEVSPVASDLAELIILHTCTAHLVKNGVHIRRSLTVPEHLAPYHFVAGVETAIAEPSDFATAVENGMVFLMGVTP